jgi:tetratricopeptide (TPR) repeat protein
MSLNNLSAMLSNLGRREHALEVSEETVAIRRRLAQARPDAFLPELATSLHNLGNRFSNLGRPQDALAAGEEAVTIRRRLAQARPDVFLPDLAMSLSNLGNMLSNLGRREDALKAAEEAVAIYRGLAQAYPDTFLPALATSLGALNQVFVGLERHADAAAVTHEGLLVIAPFVESHPQGFGNRARALGRDYIAACEKARIEPDTALLERVARMLGPQDDAAETPEAAVLREKVATILEAAEKTGALDEAALSELPEQVATQVREFWARQRS